MAKVYTDRFPANYKDYGNKKPGYYLNERLKENLDKMRSELKNDWDFFLVVDGPEGSGKSVLAMQVGMYMDPNFKIDNICFSANEFSEAVKKAKKYSCIIYDEAYGGLSSRRAMTLTNHVLVKMFTEIRQRNLSIILVLPSFFDLDKMPAIHRTRALIHVTAKNFKRGYFNFYSYKRKRVMYLMGKKSYSYSTAKPNFSGRFTKFYVVDEDEYKKRKFESLKIQSEIKEEEQATTFRACEFAFYRMSQIMGWTKKDLVRIGRDIGVGDGTLYKRTIEIRRELQARYGGDAKRVQSNRKTHTGDPFDDSGQEKSFRTVGRGLNAINKHKEGENSLPLPLGREIIPTSPTPDGQKTLAESEQNE